MDRNTDGGGKRWCGFLFICSFLKIIFFPFQWPKLVERRNVSRCWTVSLQLCHSRSHCRAWDEWVCSHAHAHTQKFITNLNTLAKFVNVYRRILILRFEGRGESKREQGWFSRNKWWSKLQQHLSVGWAGNPLRVYYYLLPVTCEIVISTPSEFNHE